MISSKLSLNHYSADRIVREGSWVLSQDLHQEKSHHDNDSSTVLSQREGASVKNGRNDNDSGQCSSDKHDLMSGGRCQGGPG